MTQHLHCVDRNIKMNSENCINLTNTPMQQMCIPGLHIFVPSKAIRNVCHGQLMELRITNPVFIEL